MNKGQYRTRYKTIDKESMLADLEIGAQLLQRMSSNTMYVQEFRRNYEDFIKTYGNTRNLSLDHAMTLARCVQYMRHLPEKNGLSGIHRALNSLTVTEMKELTAKYLTQEQRLGIVEAVEEGKIPHVYTVLHELVLDVHDAKNLTYSLRRMQEKYGTGQKEKETPVAATKTSQKVIQKGKKHDGYRKADMVPNLYAKFGMMLSPSVMNYRLYIGERLMELESDKERERVAREEYRLKYNEYRVHCLIANMFGSNSRFDPYYVARTGFKVLEVLAQPSYEPEQRAMVADLIFHWEKHYLKDDARYECPNGLRPSVEVATLAIKPENKFAVQVMHVKMRQEEGEKVESSLLTLPTPELVGLESKEEAPPELQDTTQAMQEEAPSELQDTTQAMQEEVYAQVAELDTHPGPEEIITEVFEEKAPSPVLSSPTETGSTESIQAAVEDSLRHLFKHAVEEVEETVRFQMTTLDDKVEALITATLSTLTQSNDRILREAVERRINALERAFDDKLVEASNSFVYLVRQTYNQDTERIHALERENKSLEERLAETAEYTLGIEEEVKTLRAQATEALGFAEVLAQAFASIGKVQRQTV